MPGLFQSIEIGRRALLTHQQVLQTMGHNIANVNTPGYTRRRVNLAATQSVEGVSLDEEMTNLIKFQHAYDADARIVTAMDEVLDTVIVKMGIVGR